MEGKCLYSYCGAVTSFGTILSNRWTGHTCAVSEEKARNNLAFQFKKQMGLVLAVPVSLPGKVERQKVSRGKQS